MEVRSTNYSEQTYSLLLGGIQHEPSIQASSIRSSCARVRTYGMRLRIRRPERHEPSRKRIGHRVRKRRESRQPRGRLWRRRGG